jgi:hypothetical protein
MFAVLTQQRNGDGKVTFEKRKISVHGSLASNTYKKAKKNRPSITCFKFLQTIGNGSATFLHWQG